MEETTLDTLSVLEMERLAERGADRRLDHAERVGARRELDAIAADWGRAAEERRSRLGGEHPDVRVALGMQRYAELLRYACGHIGIDIVARDDGAEIHSRRESLQWLRGQLATTRRMALGQ